MALAAAFMTYAGIAYDAGSRNLIFELVAVIPFILFVIAVPGMIASQNKKLATVFVVIGALYFCGFYLYGSFSMCPVTRSDMDAFKWMDTVLNKQAVIENNYGDAGIWIPAVDGMTITNPHIIPAYRKELYGNLMQLEPAYIYIGSKAVYPVDIKAQDLEDHYRKYRRVYSNGEAQVWKIL